MIADRKKYVMSIEVAMQREMAFRKKLENLKLEQCTTSNSSAIIIPPPLHSLVQSSTTPRINPIFPRSPTQLTIPNPPMPAPYPPPCRPNSFLCPPGVSQPPHIPPHGPSPSCLGVSRPALIPPHRPNTPHPGVSRPPLIPPHRPNSPHPGLTRPSRSPFYQQRKLPKRVKVVYSPEDFYCELCQIECNSEINFRMHLKGHKHKSMLKNLKQSNRLPGGTPTTTSTSTSQTTNEKKFCELCGVWCPDTNSFTMHLNGKNHFLKLHAAEMKLKPPFGPTSMLMP